MNIAIINQGCGKYLFEVPESITLKEGEKVKCDTRRGVTDGTVWADSITADEPAAKLIGKLLGAKFPLKSVVGKSVTSVEMFEQPKQPKQELEKLYCTKDYKPGMWVTKGKVYEVDTTGRVKIDDGYATEYSSVPLGGKPFTEYFVPLVSRPAVVGEWVYVTHTDYGNDLRVGDIAKVKSVVGRDGVSISKNEREHPHGLTYRKREYLVLDGYKPEPEYFSGKVICVDANTSLWFTAGKVYEVKNGVLNDNEGKFDYNPHSPAKTLEQLNVEQLPKFIEFKGE